MVAIKLLGIIMTDNNGLEIRAKIIVTLEVLCDSVWNPDTTVDQVLRQAKVDGLNSVTKMVTERGKPQRIRMLGEPRVIATAIEPNT